MEFFDTGTFVGGDGRRRQARRHVVIMTSNRGDKILFPDSIVHWSDAQLAAYADGIEEKTLKRLFQMKLTGRDESQIPTPVLNRVDRYTVAAPLRMSQVAEIVRRLAQKHMDAIAQRSRGLDHARPAHRDAARRALFLHHGRREAGRARRRQVLQRGEGAAAGRRDPLAARPDDGPDSPRRQRGRGPGAEPFGRTLSRSRSNCPGRRSRTRCSTPSSPGGSRACARSCRSRSDGQDDAVERTIEALTSWLSLPVGCAPAARPVLGRADGRRQDGTRPRHFASPCSRAASAPRSFRSARSPTSIG